jgi:hypothetical protein
VRIGCRLGRGASEAAASVQVRVCRLVGASFVAAESAAGCRAAVAKPRKGRRS